MHAAQLLISRSVVHPQWQSILEAALSKVDETYLQSLLSQPDWLPGSDNLLAAFRNSRQNLKYILIGESPYPRRESANGIAFYDAAVGSLWSDIGLSKAVNRATSMRNIMKSMLLAEALVEPDVDGKISQAGIARIDKSGLVQTMDQLFEKLHRAGFLMLNATPVLHSNRKPQQEATYWVEFLNQLLASIDQQSTNSPQLILWGKIAQVIKRLPASQPYDQLICEHPYNVSFIHNQTMLDLFSRLKILQLKHTNP
ncbi:MAG: uracil-DNA glycosylase family protein [Pseudomonadota bacterium]